MSSCAARVHAAAPAHAAAARLRAKHAVPALAAAPSRARRAAPRFRCDAAAGAEVADALDGSSVFLVGMMGTGKSSVGKKLAAELGYNFFDTDEIIESVTKMTIPEIFAEEGEDGFREIETQILAEIASYKKCVVATGGGIVKRKANWMHLRNGIVLCLSGSAKLLARRVADADGGASRPLFKDCDGDVDKIAEKIQEMMKERAEMYANADISVQLLVGDDGVSEGEDVDALATRVLKRVESRIAEDDTKSRLRNEPKEGDIKVTGM